MPELLNQEVLRPSLLERLSDRARFVERIKVAFHKEVLSEHGVSLERVYRAIERAGLRRCLAHDFTLEEGDEVFEASAAGLNVTDLLAARLEDGRGTVGIELSRVVQVLERKRLPSVSETRADRVITMRQVRQSVLQNVSWLLNTTHLMAETDLSGYPEVRRSVLNYGVPALAGNTESGTDVTRVAAEIKAALETFEPRLRQVVVSAIVTDRARETPQVSFQIEAQLWGDPMPERLFLHTEVDLETGRFAVRGSET